ncbi:hypothetical protein QJS10_CPB11g01495 [Acorus calamus]|uniref:DUF4283 domain-containing protein n=1 Tax=Acorus calamus TaxID=4465 RepID=A0AAV9DSQ0_ACOCL|nr:hypothetical protein QJS10_CPB11g01495 [Acorus calamus]
MARKAVRPTPDLPPSATSATGRENPSKPGIQSPSPSKLGRDTINTGSGIIYGTTSTSLPNLSTAGTSPSLVRKPAYAEAVQKDLGPGLSFNVPDEVLRVLHQNPDRVYIPNEARLQANRKRWQHTLYGRFLGPRIQIHYLRRQLAALWPVQASYFVGDLANGFYVFKFSNEQDMLAVLTGGPWIIQDHMMCLQRWWDNFDPSTASFETTPVWVRFPNLPLDFWVGLTLAELAAYAGTPLRVETAIEEIGRFRYARALIGVEKRWQQFVYERIPSICQRCGLITHATEACPTPTSHITSPRTSTGTSESPKEILKSDENNKDTSKAMNPDVLESSDTSEEKWHIVPPRRRQHQQRYQQQRESAENTPSPTHSTSMPTNNVPTDREKTPMSRIQSPKGNDLMPKKDMQLQSIPGGKMFSSPIVQPIVRAKQTSVNLEAKKDKQPLPLPPTDQLSKALVVVEQAVNRASKKKMLESSTVDTTRSLIAAHKQKELENTSHAIKLFRRSWGLDEVPSSETVMECENTNPSSSPEGIFGEQTHTS